MIKKQLEAFLNTHALLNNNSFENLELFEIGECQLNNLPSRTPDINENVLGKRLEEFFNIYIEQHPDYAMVARNIQVIEDKLTLGEIDFIVRDIPNQLILHIEMACKFYLYRPGLSPDPLACWVGPNGRDRLVYKLEKLFKKQFPLITHPVLQEKLFEAGVDKKAVTQKLFMPGQLYLPYGFHKDISPQLNPDAISGYWLSHDEFTTFDFAGGQFHLPPKKNWLLNPSQNTEWYNEDQMRTEVSLKLEGQRSPLVWMKTKKDVHHRFFVLHW